MGLRAVASRETEATPAHAIRPPLKWAGGKRWQLPHLEPFWDRHRNRRPAHEPDQRGDPASEYCAADPFERARDRHRELWLHREHPGDGQPVLVRYRPDHRDRSAAHGATAES